MEKSKIERIYSDPRGLAGEIYKREDGFFVRDVYIHAGIGTRVAIGHAADFHFNYCNERDLKEANPVLMSTLENRVWLANGESVPNAARTLEFLSDMDLVVVNGDTLDYLSYGALELMEREVWGKYPNVIVTVGGHDCVRKMQGRVDDNTTREERLDVISEFWRHDIYYTSTLLGGRVLAVALMNDPGRFYQIQVEKFKKDLMLARENGYVILMFMHEPLATRNPRDRVTRVEDLVLPGDTGNYPRNLCDGLNPEGGHWLSGGVKSSEVTMSLYNLITSNADVVRGVFAGHCHSDMYNEIIARTADGTETVIPQYVTTSNAYDGGHVMRIFVD